MKKKKRVNKYITIRLVVGVLLPFADTVFPLILPLSLCSLHVSPCDDQFVIAFNKVNSSCICATIWCNCEKLCVNRILNVIYIFCVAKITSTNCTQMANE